MGNKIVRFVNKLIIIIIEEYQLGNNIAYRFGGYTTYL